MRRKYPKSKIGVIGGEVCCTGGGEDGLAVLKGWYLYTYVRYCLCLGMGRDRMGWDGMGWGR